MKLRTNCVRFSEFSLEENKKNIINMRILAQKTNNLKLIIIVSRKIKTNRNQNINS